MDGFRYWWLLVLSVTVAVNQTAWSQSVKPRPTVVASSKPTENQPRSSVRSSDVTCKVYALNDLGSDPKLGQWIADTIPEVIQPGSWSINRPGTACYYSPVSPAQAPPPPSGNQAVAAVQGEAKRTLSYYAPGKVLVVSHTAEVHAQIGEFLQSLKKSLPQGEVTVDAPGVVVNVSPSTFEANTDSNSAAAKKATAYPIPAPQQQPKHLFHFVIRYEGDGVIESAVTGLVKKFSPENGDKPEKNEGSKTETESISPLNQLFHLIVRYEGDGLVDSNVVEFMKFLVENNKQEQRGNAYPTVPLTPAPIYSSPPSSQSCPAGTVCPLPPGGNTWRMPLADEPQSPRSPTNPSVPPPPPFPSAQSFSR